MADEKRLDLIDRKTLAEELSSLRMTITGLRAGKGVLNEFMEEYRKSVLRIVDEQPTVDAVELPCKIGDMVYRKDGAWNVAGFECDRAGSWRVKLERWKDQFLDYHESTKVVFKSFGKTVFLTSEEAEAALAERRTDG